jgi:hypothetical protein
LFFEEGHGHLRVGVGEEGGVWHGFDAEEFAHPEAGVAAAAVEGEDVVALFGPEIEDEAAFVDLVGIDAVLGAELEVAVAR